WQVYHTDECGPGVVALFTLQTAAEGGLFKISSFGKVYNHLVENRPDLIGTLAQVWPYDNFGGNPPYYVQPMIAYVDGKMIVQISRRRFTGFGNLDRSEGVPPISEEQAEALDTLQFLADKYAFGLQAQKGDILYFNNLGLIHTREGFKNDKEHM
ncbi:hypothetical protein HWV62_24147, partial [Athelia sp. TMB]